MKLLSWAASDVGRKRDHNEDSYLVDETVGLYAVADGMGGHQGGAQASKMAVEVLEREMRAVASVEASAERILADDPDARFARLLGPSGAPLAAAGTEPPPPPAAAMVLRSAARTAGREIYETAQEDEHLAGMGTTLTAAYFHDGRVLIAHVGDSRAFLYRDGRAEQVTLDHSWIAEQLRAGVISEEEARDSRFRHIITRSVGFEPDVEVDLVSMAVQPGDCLLMCSDGMSNYFEPEEIGRILATTYYRKVPRLLVDLANDRGGDDNITVVLVCAANE